MCSLDDKYSFVIHPNLCPVYARFLSVSETLAIVESVSFVRPLFHGTLPKLACLTLSLRTGSANGL